MRPGFEPRRIARLIHRCVQEAHLDLTGEVVLTEAATGAYAVTPVIAAVAGAEVVAVTADSPYGSVQEVRECTRVLADLLGVRNRILVTTSRNEEVVAPATIVTNSGHLRPLDATFVSWLTPDAVVSLMFEAWEVQAGRFDVDLAALRLRGIRVAGTNERHGPVGVFDYLGAMAVKLFIDAGIPTRDSSIAVLCDNDFGPYLEQGLSAAGGDVHLLTDGTALASAQPADVLVVAMRPTGVPVLGAQEAALLAAGWAGTTVLQYWGDIDRETLDHHDLRYWPLRGPATGHMAVIPSDIGPDPVVRLQTGGLKVGSVLRQPDGLTSTFDRGFVDAL